jgi:hypothetical protein
MYVSAARSDYEEIFNLSCSQSFPDRMLAKNDACWQGYARLEGCRGLVL